MSAVAELVPVMPTRRALRRRRAAPLALSAPARQRILETLKYRPDFPERFEGIEHARLHLREFFAWYNEQHRHSGIGFMTPAMVHFGRSRAIDEHRRRVLQAAYAAHPERFKGRLPIPPALPAIVGINLPPPEPTQTTHDLTTTTRVAH